MAVDVESEVRIERPRAEVAAYAADPDNAPEWYANIEAVEWKTSPPLAVGSRIAFVADFLGRRLIYTYEVTDLDAGRRLVMGTTAGPLAMETTYTWDDDGGGATRMTLRNRGEPAGLAKLARPIVERAVGHANRKDLGRLKELLEAAAA